MRVVYRKLFRRDCTFSRIASFVMSNGKRGEVKGWLGWDWAFVLTFLLMHIIILTKGGKGDGLWNYEGGKQSV